MPTCCDATLMTCRHVGCKRASEKAVACRAITEVTLNLPFARKATWCGGGVAPTTCVLSAHPRPSVFQVSAQAPSNRACWRLPCLQRFERQPLPQQCHPRSGHLNLAPGEEPMRPDTDHTTARRRSLRATMLVLAVSALAFPISDASAQTSSSGGAAAPAEIQPGHKPPSAGRSDAPSGPQSVVPSPLPPGSRADTLGGSARDGVITPPGTAGSTPSVIPK